MPRPISLRTRLLGILAACLLPPLAVMAWVEVQRHHALEAEVHADTLREAGQLAGEVARLVDGIEHLLQAVAASPLARQHDPAACDEYLRQLQQASHGSASLGVTDAQGNVTCLSRRGNAQQLQAGDRFYFTETMRRNAMTTGLFSLGKTAGAKTVHFGYPVQDERGRAIGVAFAPLNLDWLAQQLADRRLPPHTSVTVADREGRVLVRLPQTRMAGQALPPEWQALASAPAPGTALLPDLVDGRPEIVGYVPLGHGPSGLFVALGQQRDAALQPARAALQRALLLAVIGTLLAAGLAGALIERHVQRPLARLWAMVAALGRGDERARIDVTTVGDAELVRIAEALNALAAELGGREARRTQAESALRQARDRAEASSRSLGELLTVASHDLRQPIHSMVLSAALLTQKLKGSPDEPAAQRLQRSAQQLVEMLDSVLNVSQLDAGRIRPDVRTLALGDLLRSVGEEFAVSAAAAGVALQWQATPLWVHSDPALLRRILVNFVSNAVKYTPRGGEVRLDCAVDGPWAVLSVSDSGIGIAPEQQAQVWEEFRQLGNPERELKKGLGLGLAIVRRVAELLGHPVDLWSAPGQGTRFSVRVPLAEHGARTHDEPPLQRLAGRLLLVDDDEAVAASTAELLRELGLDVTVCGSAESAFALLEAPQQPFDAVLADFRLPALSGLEVLRSAHRRWPGMATLLMSGGLPRARAEECEAEGVTCLLKPVDPAQLADALRPLRAEPPG